MDSEIPSRNPLSYCRLCLSQVNLLTVLESQAEANQSPMKEVMQRLHQYTKITLESTEDFPCAICGVCQNQLTEFHEFRLNVVRHHNAVKIFRRTFGDEIERVDMEGEDEEDQQYVEIIEDPQLVDIIREEYGDTAELKEVDVYHVNGELRTVVVKAEPEESSSPATVIQVSSKKTPPASVSPVSAKKPPPVNILNKASGHVLPTMPSPPKRVTKPSGTAFTVYKCPQCTAVFQSPDNLAIHERTDHPKPLKQQSPKKEPTRLVVNKTAPPKRPHQPHSNNILFKCTGCSSSFVQEQNLRQHQITCKPAALSRLDLSQITIKRTKIQHQQHQEPPKRMQCPNCPLHYKNKIYLDKHLLSVHKISPQQHQQHFCPLCNLNYSCPQDLQLHNRALHPFLCMTCSGDFRQCMHQQPSVRESVSENGGANKAT